MIGHDSHPHDRCLLHVALLAVPCGSMLLHLTPRYCAVVSLSAAYCVVPAQLLLHHTVKQQQCIACEAVNVELHLVSSQLYCFIRLACLVLFCLK